MASARMLLRMVSQQVGSGQLAAQFLPACTQAAAGWRPVQHAWVTPQQYHLRHFASEPNSESKASGVNTTAKEADQAAAAAADQAAADEQAGSSELSELQELLIKAQEEAASFKDRWQRSHAEMQNLIARQAREKETMQTYAVQKFAQSLLEVADNLESAQRAVPAAVLQPGAEVSTEKALAYLKALLEGVQATERVLLKNMSTKGVERIETAEGDDFDPNTQEAMTTMPAAEGKKPNTVASVWQSGYKMHDRILRAAKVIVYQE